jgi:thiol-disulfide isomerase/thioredoxin
MIMCRLLLSLVVEIALLSALPAEPPHTPDGSVILPTVVTPHLAPHASNPLVLVFLSTDCPVSNRYAPILAALVREFKPAGIRFVAVYPDPTTDREDIRQHQKEYGLDLPAVRDPDHRVVEAVGAKATPEVAVLIWIESSDPGAVRRLIYRGRIDDRYVSRGKDRGAPSKQDLRDALLRVVAGESVQPRFTQPIGCHIER